jgi:hypothetical protein
MGLQYVRRAKPSSQWVWPQASFHKLVQNALST